MKNMIPTNSGLIMIPESLKLQPIILKIFITISSGSFCYKSQSALLEFTNLENPVN